MMSFEHAPFDQATRTAQPLPPAGPDGSGSAIVAAVRRQAAYAAEAHLYALRTRVFHQWRRKLVELLPLRSGEVVLDVGCGAGLCFSLVQQRIGPDGRIIAIEPSPSMLTLARQRVARHTTSAIR
jgi:protein-L-isoaspartate O-methyltransferase